MHHRPRSYRLLSLLAAMGIMLAPLRPALALSTAAPTVAETGSADAGSTADRAADLLSSGWAAPRAEATRIQPAPEDAWSSVADERSRTKEQTRPPHDSDLVKLSADAVMRAFEDLSKPRTGENELDEPRTKPPNVTRSRVSGTPVPPDCLPIDDGKSINGKIDGTGVQHCFSFRAEAGALVTIYLVNDTSGEVRLELSTPDGSRLRPEDIDGDEAFIEQELPEDGTYTVRVSGVAGAVGSYTLHLFNPSYDIISPIADAQSIGNTIEFPGDEDGFTFEGKAGDMVTVYVTNGTSGQLWAYLVSPDGTRLADEISAGNVLLYHQELPEDGPYVVVVNGSGAAVGPYTLHLFNPSYEIVSHIADGQSIDSSIELPGDEDAFMFAGEAGEFVSVHVDNLTTGETRGLRIEIFNPDGSTLIAQRKTCCNEDISLRSVELPQDGTYIILIDGYQDSTGPYALQLIQPSRHIISDIVSGEPISGTIGLLSQDTYAFEGQAGDVVSVFLDNHTTGGQRGVRTFIVAPDGSDVASHYTVCCNEDVRLRSVELTEDGTYTILIDGYQDSTGPYALQLIRPSRRLIADIVSGESISGTIGILSQDTYAFEGQAGDVVSVFVDNHTTGDQKGLRTFIIAPDGSDLASRYTVCCNEDISLRSVELLQNGTYTILIDGYQDSTGPYAVQLIQPSRHFISDIVSGKSISGTIGILSQDTFAFEGQAGDMVSLFVDNHTTGGQKGLRTFIIAPDGSDLASRYTVCCNEDIGLPSVELLLDGTYTILIDGYADSTGPYVMSLVSINSDLKPLLFAGHEGAVTSVAFSPDGTRLLTGSTDNTAALWEAASGASERVLDAHSGDVTTVAFSPDGAVVLTGSEDSTILLWDVDSGGIIGSLGSRRGHVYSAAFSADGSQVLVGGRATEVALWDVASDERIRTFDAHSDNVTSVAFSPDGTQILSGSRDGTAILWDRSSGMVIQVFDGHTDDVTAVDFSPSGAQIVTGSRDQTLRLWDVSSGEEIRRIRHPAAITSVDFAPDGRLVAAAADSLAYVWDIFAGTLAVAVGQGREVLRALAFSPDGTVLATGGEDDVARLWKLDWYPWGARHAEHLTPGVAQEDSVAPMVWRDYAVEMEGGRSLVLEVTPHEDAQTLWAYARRSAMPTLPTFDTRSLQRSARNTYELLISPTQRGTYYFGVFGRDVDPPSGSFRIMASSPETYLSNVTPETGGNKGEITLSLSGLGFVEGMDVELNAQGLAAVTAESVAVDSALSLLARFDLQDAKVGIYDVTALWPGGQVEQLDGAFQVVPGIGAHLEAALFAPEAIRRGRNYVLTLEYTNRGDADMDATLFAVASPQELPMRLSPDQPYSTRLIQVPGISLEHPAGVLRPGLTQRVPIHLLADGDLGGAEINVYRASTDDSPVNWESVGEDIVLADSDAEWWSIVRANLEKAMGATQSKFQAALNEMATHVSLSGEEIVDMRALLHASVSRASGVYFRSPLTWNQDAYSPAQGLPLAFDRMLIDGIAQRFAIGPFGRAWSHSYQYRITQPSDDVAMLWRPGGTQSSFSRSEGETWQGGAGDGAVLRDTAGGGYQLKDGDGLTWDFNRSGRLVSIQDPHGNELSLSYDGDHLTEIHHSNGESLTLKHDSRGRITQLIDHAGDVTTYTYDDSGEHLQSVEAPGGVRTEYRYVSGDGGSSAHALREINQPDGTHRYFAYDEMGRLSAQWRDGGAERVEYTYDPVGIVRIKDGTGATSELHVGLLGEPIAYVDPSGSRVELQFDASRNLSAVSGANGEQFSLARDQNGRVTELTDALGNTKVLGYDGDSARRAWVREATGHTTKYSYDTAGNLIGVTYPDGSEESFAYGEEGRLTSATNRRAATIEYTYDERGRIARKDYPDGSWVAYEYDSSGRLAKASDDSGAIEMTRDDRGFLTHISYPSGDSFAYSYNDAGRLTRRVSAGGYSVDYRYDSLGRLEQLAGPGGDLIVQYEYDLAGRLVRETKGNLTSTAYEYDPSGRVTSIVNSGPDGGEQSRFDYAYDARGYRSSMKTADGTITYHHDAMGQLLSVTDPTGRLTTYEYGARGERISTSTEGVTTPYVTNNLGLYTQVGSATYDYDEDGNLVSKTDSTVTTTYEYDAENRLTRVTTSDGHTWVYSYDALGNLTTVERDGEVTRYVYDPVGLIGIAGEYDESGSLVARYIEGLGLVGRSNSEGEISYYGYDVDGNTSQLSDGDGEVVNSYAYSPFGEPTGSSEAVPNPFQHAGRLGAMTQENGLNVLGKQFYSPDQGRFVGGSPYCPDRGRLSGHDYAHNKPLGGFSPLDLAGPGGFGADVFGVPSPGGLSDYVNHVQTALGVLGDAGFETAGKVGSIMSLPGYYKDLFGGLWDVAAGGAQGDDSLMIHGAVKILFNAGSTAVMAIWGTAMLSNPFLLPLYALMTFGNKDAMIDAITNLVLWLSGREMLAKANTKVVGAIDPNEKAGPAGQGDERLVGPGLPLTYIVYFENLPEASAAAQEVVVEDQLDPYLDWASFTPLEVAFGDRVVPILDGTYEFSTRQIVGDYRDDVDSQWWLDVTGGINPINGRARWVFRTLDPMTGDLPEDAMAGFLPPNDDTHRGEGHVAFAVDPLANLPDGTIIRNEATIVFDVEASVDTNVVTNTIGTAPCSDGDYKPVDLMLVIDRSESMSHESKLGAAKHAVLTLLEQMDLAQEQAGIASFAGTANLDQPLTGNLAAMEAYLDQLAAGGETAIGDGIAVAQQELESHRHQTGHTTTIVLLSDGQNIKGQDPLAAATAAKSAGTVILTVGLGTGVDAEMLRQIATSPQHYFFAPEPQDLAAIYASIVGDVRCQP